LAPDFRFEALKPNVPGLIKSHNHCAIPVRASPSSELYLLASGFRMV
jgi:hypothetical protein